MTYEQAIHTIKKGCIYRDKRGSEALEVAVECLEKQIPKKPNIHGYREGREINTISYTCPVCNKHIGRDVYCKHCGTALDWSDTE